jgi:hypothetical protein
MALRGQRSSSGPRGSPSVESADCAGLSFERRTSSCYTPMERGKQENDTVTPLVKIRAALERKAARGDVQAARELRENADYCYGSASGGERWPSLLGADSDVPVDVRVAQVLASASHHRSRPSARRCPALGLRRGSLPDRPSRLSSLMDFRRRTRTAWALNPVAIGSIVPLDDLRVRGLSPDGDQRSLRLRSGQGSCEGQTRLSSHQASSSLLAKASPSGARTASTLGFARDRLLAD